MKGKLFATAKGRKIVVAICVLVVLVLGLAAYGGSATKKADTQVYTFAGYDFTLPKSFQGPGGSSTDTSKYFYPEEAGKLPTLMINYTALNSSLPDSAIEATFDYVQKGVISKFTNGNQVKSESITVDNKKGRRFQFTGASNGTNISGTAVLFYDSTKSQIVDLIFAQSSDNKTSYLDDFDSIVSSVKTSSASSATSAAATSTAATSAAATSTAATSTAATSTTATTSSSSAKSATTYQDILDEYTQKLQDATPGLIDEYNNEAASNTDGTEGLAKICNAKVSKLAAISTEGTQKMAQLMYKSGNGSYNEYQDWATKLNDVYTEEAQKITDAYMSSAM